MNTLFGCVTWDGSAVAEQDVVALDAALSAAAGNPVGLWRAAGVVLGGHVLSVTPESEAETTPLASADGRLVMVATARLDQRGALGTALGLEGERAAGMADTALLLAAFERWGEAMVDHVSGDWACAVWDVRQRRLFLARDRHGVSALHYYRTPRGIVFATTLRALVSAPSVPRQPNPLRVAQLLITWAEHGPMTSYADVWRLPPSHCLSLSAAQPLAEARRYWVLEQSIRPLFLPSAADYAEGLLDVYRAAVAERLRSRSAVGITLSGGLDSGSVAALAGPLLHARGQTLHAFTSVPRLTPFDAGPRRFADEAEAARATAAFVPGVHWQAVDAAGCGVLEGMRRSLQVHAEPMRAASASYWIHSLFEAARAEGVGVLLSGQHGNATVSWNGLPAGWAGLREHLRCSGLAHLVRGLLLPVRRQMARHEWGAVPRWEHTSALRLDKARALRLRERVLEGSDAPSLQGVGASLYQRLSLLKPGWSNLDSVWAAWAAHYGIEVRDPTGALPVIEFCLSVPDEQFTGPPHDRRLLRNAFAGLLPDVVRLETRRGLQSADQLARLRGEAAEVEQVLAELEANELAREWLDLERMRLNWHEILSTTDRLTWVRSIHILLRGITVGQFLLQFR